MAVPLSPCNRWRRGGRGCCMRGHDSAANPYRFARINLTRGGQEVAGKSFSRKRNSLLRNSGGSLFEIADVASLQSQISK
ncbi:hypothetical protein CEXT_265931 [Caerostris extrusa]|uniref:Uncharacterized protein n=1 Tax=Caerostris extrusa TaxID=172846 RepID=A0AAV4X516_CAEEX|nr:hypothetical protein CEXT_265931 [Caerostris extrusa]